MKVTTTFRKISSAEVFEKFNTANLQAFIDNSITPVIEQFMEFGEHDDIINSQLENHEGIILFDNADEMYEYMRQHNLQTGMANDSEEVELYEVTSKTEQYEDYVYIRGDGGMPDEGLTIACIYQ